LFDYCINGNKSVGHGPLIKTTEFVSSQNDSIVIVSFITIVNKPTTYVDIEISASILSFCLACGIRIIISGKMTKIEKKYPQFRALKSDEDHLSVKQVPDFHVKR
jgi:hypothetical protein